MEELNEKKTKYFVIAIIILIILGVLLIVHFNNKEVVKGEKDRDTKTTEKITTTTTTTKKRVNVKVNEPIADVYKSVIDEEHKLVYNYKLTEEILEADKIVAKRMLLPETLIGKDIIALFDISLYDSNMIKKTVVNSLINVKIPLTDELKGYDEYKVVYVNDNNEITEEQIETKVNSDYIEFNTSHLSLFAIIATKKVVEEVNLDSAKIILQINDGVLISGEEAYNVTYEKDSEIKLFVDGVDADYEVYYSLKNDNEYIDYKLFDKDIIKNMPNASKYTLTIKLVVGEIYKEFTFGEFTIYDEIFVYDKEAQLEEDVIIGEIENETDYDYTDKEINKDILIDYTEDLDEPIVSEEETNIENNEEITENNATIKVNGNIYLIEKADISELEMTGHLFIDTNEDIIFAQNEEELIELSNLYSITIRSKEFILNGVKYAYEYTPEGDLVIYKVVEVEENEETATKQEEIAIQDFEAIFSEDYKVVVDENEKDLIIEKVVAEEPKTEEENEETTEEQFPSEEIIVE